MRVAIATLAIMAHSAIASAQGVYEVKGYVVGAPMETCPAETIKRTTLSGLLVCGLGATTLANQRVDALNLFLHGGRIAGFMFDLAERGRVANREVRDALEAKFGRPSDSKPHLNEYRWASGNEVMKLDGWRGSLIVMDAAVARRASEGEAHKNKSDL